MEGCIEIIYDDNVVHSTVEVAGDFNHWQPAPLSLDSATRYVGVFKDMTPGARFVYKFRVDNKWTILPTLPVSKDKSGQDNHTVEAVPIAESTLLRKASTKNSNRSSMLVRDRSMDFSTDDEFVSAVEDNDTEGFEYDHLSQVGNDAHNLDVQYPHIHSEAHHDSDASTINNVHIDSSRDNELSANHEPSGTPTENGKQQSSDVSVKDTNLDSEIDPDTFKPVSSGESNADSEYIEESEKDLDTLKPKGYNSSDPKSTKRRSSIYDTDSDDESEESPKKNSQAPADATIVEESGSTSETDIKTNITGSNEANVFARTTETGTTEAIDPTPVTSDMYKVVNPIFVYASDVSQTSEPTAAHAVTAKGDEERDIEVADPAYPLVPSESKKVASTADAAAAPSQNETPAPSGQANAPANTTKPASRPVPKPVKEKTKKAKSKNPLKRFFRKVLGKK